MESCQPPKHSRNLIKVFWFVWPRAISLRFLSVVLKLFTRSAERAMECQWKVFANQPVGQAPRIRTYAHHEADAFNNKVSMFMLEKLSANIKMEQCLKKFNVLAKTKNQWSEITRTWIFFLWTLLSIRMDSKNPKRWLQNFHWIFQFSLHINGWIIFVRWSRPAMISVYGNRLIRNVAIALKVVPASTMVIISQISLDFNCFCPFCFLCAWMDIRFSPFEFIFQTYLCVSKNNCPLAKW